MFLQTVPQNEMKVEEVYNNVYLKIRPKGNIMCLLHCLKHLKKKRKTLIR